MDVISGINSNRKFMCKLPAKKLNNTTDPLYRLIKKAYRSKQATRAYDRPITCDQAFADYLIYQSRRLRVEGVYIRTLKVVLIMRNYLNQEGYQHITRDAVSKFIKPSFRFTEIEKSKFITLLSNQFMIYARKEHKDKEWMPLKDELIEEVEQIC